MTKTTKSDFELFCKECLRWQDILGLHGFEINFFHTDEDKGDFCYCNINPVNRTVLIELCKKWPDEKYKKTNEQIKLSAFHEVCHILMDLLSSCARARYICSHEIDESEHAIIRTLERVLFSKYKEG